MRALVKAKAEPSLWLQDVPEPQIGINDVSIRVRKRGICGTDLHIHSWDAWAAKTIPVPMVVEHEFVGEIVEVGANVSDFSPGDIVSGEGHVVCGRCRNCMAVAVVRHAGARHIVVSEPNTYRRDLALRMGATVAVDPGATDLAAVQKELGMTEGFDVALEMPTRHPDGRADARCERHRLQHADAARHLRPPDVRDLVPESVLL